jgi:hypothetical protein
MPVPIGLTGLAGAGKDTAFGYLREWAEERGVLARRRSFADALKLSFARMFIPDCSVDEAVIWCNELKFSGTLRLSWDNADAHQGTLTTIEHRISGRTALQRYGTEGHRDVFGDNFWVDVLFPLSEIRDMKGDRCRSGYERNFMGPLDQEPPDICVAADTRFENEARRIKELKGYNLSIVRPVENGGLDLGKIEGQHSSEAGVPVDLIDETIWNTRDLEYLREQIFLWADTTLSRFYPPAAC